MSNVDPKLKQAFEPRSPGILRRLQAMERLAREGIPVGTSLMPIIPFVGDDEGHLADTVRATREHGGSFVLASGLTMSGVQAEHTLRAAARHDASKVPQWRAMYRWPEAGAPCDEPSPRVPRSAGFRELCDRWGLRDRIPRYVGSGPRSRNCRIAELLFLKTYDLELALAPESKIWAYRKAAWVVDDWPDDLADVHQAGGEAALRALPGIGASIGQQIAGWLQNDA